MGRGAWGVRRGAWGVGRGVGRGVGWVWGSGEGWAAQGWMWIGRRDGGRSWKEGRRVGEGQRGCLYTACGATSPPGVRGRGGAGGWGAVPPQMKMLRVFSGGAGRDPPPK
jgi:hypothetical protein